VTPTRSRPSRRWDAERFDEVFIAALPHHVCTLTSTPSPSCRLAISLIGTGDIFPPPATSYLSFARDCCPALEEL
jgi:hypothetical protein